jgi:hypothetical protein
LAVITLTTDFGSSDHYGGVVKGVILGIDPQAVIVDLTQQVARHEVSSAAFLLLAAHRYFPYGTIHLVVVDPGVGSQRRLLAAKSGGYFYVAPDNGVISYLLDLDQHCELRWLDNLDYRLPRVGDTFHGRDILAPAAAYLSSGIPLDQLGGPAAASDLVRLPPITPDISGDSIIGRILYIDQFGNLTTNISLADLWGGAFEDITIETGPIKLHGLVRAYAEVEPGAMLAIGGSSGFLEIARNMGRADTIPGLSINATVRVSRKSGKNP